jgi:hypothetical protein
MLALSATLTLFDGVDFLLESPTLILQHMLASWIHSIRSRTKPERMHPLITTSSNDASLTQPKRPLYFWSQPTTPSNP